MYYDKKEQYEKIAPYILSGEELISVYDCKGVGTGFVGITNKRLIFYDQEMTGWVKNKNMASVPYSKIVAVSALDSGTFIKTSTIVIMTSAGKYSFEFRGSDKAIETYKYIMNKILQ